MSERPAPEEQRADGERPEPASGEPVRPSQAEPEWLRRRRLAQIFGDVLPETTSDERDERGERPQSSDDWLTAQVPPHHGG